VRVVCADTYPDQLALDMLDAAGVTFEIWADRDPA